MNHSFDKNESRIASKYLAPLFLFLGLFIVIPVLGTFWTSLFQDVAFLENKFIGFANYSRVLQDAAFWQAVRFTGFFILASVPLELFLGLLFALVLNESVPFRGLLRVCVLIPWAIPSAISARIWELIYNYHYGLANFILTGLQFIGGPMNWLGTSGGAFFALVLADAWKTTPFVAIILLAGLQAIPEELYAQAKVDRANLFERFVRITLPLLRPVILVALLFRTIDALRIFDLIYVLTHGGPGGRTNSLSVYSYNFFLSSDFGYGSTVSVLLFFAALALAVFYVKAGRFGEEIAGERRKN